MLYIYHEKNIKEFGADLLFWSNGCGELHHRGEYDIEENDLPEPLKRAYKELYDESTGSYCYLCEFKGQYHVALINEFSEEDMELGKEELYEFVLNKANKISTLLYENVLVVDAGVDTDNVEIIVLVDAMATKIHFYMITQLLYEFAYDQKKKDISWMDIALSERVMQLNTLQSLKEAANKIEATGCNFCYGKDAKKLTWKVFDLDKADIVEDGTCLHAVIYVGRSSIGNSWYNVSLYYKGEKAENIFILQNDSANQIQEMLEKFLPQTQYLYLDTETLEKEEKSPAKVLITYNFESDVILKECSSEECAEILMRDLLEQEMEAVKKECGYIPVLQKDDAVSMLLYISVDDFEALKERGKEFEIIDIERTVDTACYQVL